MKKSLSERERVIRRLNVQLLEAKAVKPDWEGGGSMYWDVCGECHTAIARQDKFCRQCGKEIDWS